MVKVIKPYYVIEDFDGKEMLRKIELAGRTCYKSEDKITENSSTLFVAMSIHSGHESVLEHEKVSVRVICDRGITHEIVRHRIGSYSQESTRYCNYSKQTFGKQITVIDPRPHMNNEEYNNWLSSVEYSEQYYFKLLELGTRPQMARSVLPNSLKTEIVITYNLREWRHFFKLRTSVAAHPQLREITVPMLKEFKERLPGLLEDIDGNEI